VVAQAVKEAVGVGGDAGCCRCDKRAERRRLAFKRNFDEHVAIDIGVEGGVGFDKVALRLHRHGGVSAGDLHHQLEADAHHRVDSDRLVHGGESRGRNRNLVAVERNVGEDELAGRVSSCGAIDAAIRIGEAHRRVRNDGAGGIGNAAANSAGVAALRGCGEGTQSEDNEGKSAKKSAVGKRHRKYLRKS